MDTNFKRPLSGLLDKTRMMKINISKQKSYPLKHKKKHHQLLKDSWPKSMYGKN